MPGRVISLFIPILFSLNHLASSSSFAGEPSIKFDVPALVGVKEVQNPQGQLGNEKIIEVIIPVSSEVTLRDRSNVDEFRFDVYWNRNVYPIADYAPKTQTVSEIEGLISIEKSQDRSAGIGINFNAGYQKIGSGAAKADFSKRDGTRTKFQQVPQHEVLVASGTVQRGTGAFFRFHPSKTETLEGGRDLVVAYRVPLSWRGGVLKIECRADGHRKIIGQWRDPFDQTRAFVLPIYLDSDEQARQAAVNFVRTEQNLRLNWQQHLQQNESSATGPTLFPRSTNNSGLPDQWMHLLIQSGNDAYLNKYKSQLSSPLATAANEFVTARQSLLSLSR